MPEFWWALAVTIIAPWFGIAFGRAVYKDEVPKLLVALICGAGVFGGILDISDVIERWMGWYETIHHHAAR